MQAKDGPPNSGEYGMRRALQLCSLWIASLCFIFSSPARATVFVYQQTSASVPGLSINAAMTIDGGLNNLPTLSQSSAPIDFGNLLAFDLLAPNGMTYTLADFVAPFDLGFHFPQWSISPSGISFIDATDLNDFFISFHLGTIQFDTDGPSSPPYCSRTGACISTGHWASIPEPSGATLIIVGLLALYFFVGSARHHVTRAPDSPEDAS